MMQLQYIQTGPEHVRVFVPILRTEVGCTSNNMYSPLGHPEFPCKNRFSSKNSPLAEGKVGSARSSSVSSKKKGLRILSNLTVGMIRYY